MKLRRWKEWGIRGRLLTIAIMPATITNADLSEGETQMEKQHAVKILNSLANGVDPATGEVFAADSPYQHPDTVRALFEAIRSIDGARPAIEQQKKATAGFVRWTQEEEQRLAAGFDAGKSTVELAQLHNRSPAAIEARLLKFDKIDVSALTVQLRYGQAGE